ncbi:MAG: hypothetical protein JWQ79_3284 [Mucilaginibacter sp.]|nr:hypothetical protein [Mucilaginibacter sp.]
MRPQPNMFRLEKPPISTKPIIMFIHKKDEVNYDLLIDGNLHGYIIHRNNEWHVEAVDYALTDMDKEFIIKCADSI